MSAIKAKKIKLFSLLFPSLFCFFACSHLILGRNPQDFEFIAAHEVQWNFFEPGIRHAFFEKKNHFFVSIFEISLEDPDLELIFSTPQSTQYNLFSSQKTSRFTEAHDCVIGVNMAPYFPYRFFENQEIHVSTLYYYQSSLFSPPSHTKTNGAFYYNPNENSMDLNFQHNFPILKEKFPIAIGGFQLLRFQGESLPLSLEKMNSKARKSSRTLLGFSPEKKILFISTFFSPWFFFHKGVSEYEAQLFFERLNIDSVLNMDGGISTSLSIQKKKKIYTVPVNSKYPFLNDLPLASHLCIKKNYGASI